MALLKRTGICANCNHATNDCEPVHCLWYASEFEKALSRECQILEYETADRYY